MRTASEEKIDRMHEYVIYLPRKQTDGRDVSVLEIQGIKRTLAQAFGGYTQMTQRCEGVWRLDGVTFRDEITIIRVLDNGRCNFDMSSFRKTLERKLNQEHILIVDREVRTL